jgi:hypothetical protein
MAAASEIACFQQLNVSDRNRHIFRDSPADTAVLAKAKTAEKQRGMTGALICFEYMYALLNYFHLQFLFYPISTIRHRSGFVGKRIAIFPTPRLPDRVERLPGASAVF